LNRCEHREAPSLLTSRPDTFERACAWLQKTLEYHWGKHHRAYVDNLNKQIAGTELDSKSNVADIVRACWNGGKPTSAFNNAAQTWSARLTSCLHAACACIATKLGCRACVS
jgi:superoxide dismutase